jgi:soluble lytic murein transglycosylase
MKKRKRSDKDTVRIRRAWTIVCLMFVVTIALLARGVLIYRIYPLEYADAIKQYSAEYALDPNLVCAVINAESNFNPDAESHMSAKGLMQLLPSTAAESAARIGIDDFSEDMLTDPETNIRIGCEYLHYLSGLFNGNEDYMIAAYNAGLGNVREWIATDRGLRIFRIRKPKIT